MIGHRKVAMRLAYPLCGLAAGVLFSVAASAGPPDVPATPAPILVTGSIAPAAATGAPSPGLAAIVEAYRRGERARGDALAATLTDPDERRAMEWVAIRTAGEPLPVARLKRFLREDPDFAGAEFVKRRIENALFAHDAGASEVIDFFERRAPAMPAGKLALAEALRDKGFMLIVPDMLRAAWRSDDLSADVERAIRERFPGMIRPEDHRARAKRLAYARERAAAIAASKPLPAEEAALVRALADALAGDRGAGARVPAALRRSPEAALIEAMALRRAGRHAEAADRLLAAPAPDLDAVGGSAWWREERALVRGLLDRGDPMRAYRVAAASRAVSGEDRSEAAFLAGLVAAHYTNQPAAARAHFEAAARDAERPASMARALFWLARAIEREGGDAAPLYARAARHEAHFYGQLAAARIGRPVLSVPAARPMSGAAVAAVASRPEARMIRLLYAAGGEPFARTLASLLAGRLETPGEIDALARLLWSKGDRPQAVALGRAAVQRGVMAADAAFPVGVIPPEAGRDVETALLYAIARQESSFDADAVSGAGARGLMQLMPMTARETARRIGMAAAPARLDDPAVNARLGAAYLDELERVTRGSTILMLAAYNAGPSRMREWRRAYGDPRDPSVDPVLWIERVPFNETRLYIQKVLENLHVYRARLTPELGLGALAELHRGQPVEGPWRR
jgi:soluble lytic murein transglycosylase